MKSLAILGCLAVVFAACGGDQTISINNNLSDSDHAQPSSNVDAGPSRDAQTTSDAPPPADAPGAPDATSAPDAGTPPDAPPAPTPDAPPAPTPDAPPAPTPDAAVPPPPPPPPPSLADVKVTLSPSTRTPYSGQTMDYSVLVANLGNAVARETMLVIDYGQLGQSLAYVPGGCTNNEPVAGQMTCHLEPLVENDSVTVMYSVTVSAVRGTLIESTVIADTDSDSDYGNNDDRVTVVVSDPPAQPPGDLKVTIIPSTRTPYPGQTMDMMVLVENTGTAPAFGMKVTIDYGQLGQSLAYVPWGCTNNEPVALQMTCYASYPMYQGSNFSVSTSVMVRASATVGSVLSTSATARSSNGDRDFNDNSAASLMTIAPPPPPPAPDHALLNMVVPQGACYQLFNPNDEEVRFDCNTSLFSLPAAPAPACTTYLAHYRDVVPWITPPDEPVTLCGGTQVTHNAPYTQPIPGTLTISHVSGSFLSKILLGGDTSQIVTMYQAFADGESFNIDRLTIVNDAANDGFEQDPSEATGVLSLVRLWYFDQGGNFQEASAPLFGNAVTFSGLGFTVPQGNLSTYFWIAVDVANPAAFGENFSGQTFRLGLQDSFNTASTFSAVGQSSLTSTNAPTINGSASVAEMTVRRSVPTFTRVVDSSPILFNGENTLYTLGVSAAQSGSISLGRLVFDVSQTGLTAVDQIRVFRDNVPLTPGDENTLGQVYTRWDSGPMGCFAHTSQSGQGTGMDCSGGLAPSSRLIISFPFEEVITPAHTTLYRITATVQGASPGSELRTQLSTSDQQNGRAMGQIYNATGVNALFSGSGNFADFAIPGRSIIWSDRSANPHTVATMSPGAIPTVAADSSADWINGYLLEIPAVNILTSP